MTDSEAVNSIFKKDMISYHVFNVSPLVDEFSISTLSREDIKFVILYLLNRHYYLDITKAEYLLGYREYITLVSSIGSVRVETEFLNYLAIPRYLNIGARVDYIYVNENLILKVIKEESI